MPGENKKVSEEFYFQDDPYFHPRLEIEDSNRKSKILELVGEFLLSKQKINRLVEDIRKEAHSGLQPETCKQDLKASFPMFNTYVHKFPTGKERGVFLGLDIGGTNLRIVSLKIGNDNAVGGDLDGKTEPELVTEYYDVPAEFRQSGSKVFFDFLADSIKKFIEKNIPEETYQKKPLPMGFTFSFGFDQLAINRGKCLQFGIATNLPDALGKCPLELLQNSIDALKLPVKLIALANDSTTTLVYGKYLQPETCAGLILGSGSNVAYIQNVYQDKRIVNAAEVFKTSDEPKEFVVNTECVLYGDYHQMDFAKSRYDFELDAMSLMPNSYTYEKLVGGAFLGELFRLALLDLVRNRLLLKGKFTPKIVKPYIITTPQMSLIEKNILECKSYSEIDSLLVECLGYESKDVDQRDLLIVAYVCQVIVIRSAIFCAIALAGFMDRMDIEERYDVVKISCDGSLFGKHPKMERLINAYLQQLIPNRKTKVFWAPNGSSIGAALLAAVFIDDVEQHQDGGVDQPSK